MKDSHAATIRFGSLIEDLACYLDSSLRRNEEGTIVGRNPGVKGWLQENIPALFLRYSTVMRYKSAARKLKQLTNIDDPIPAAAIVCDYGADETQAGAKTAWDGDVKARDGGGTAGNVDAKIRQARGVWLKMIADVSPYPTPLLARIDGLLGAPVESLQPDSASHDSHIA